jgi:hypothetical protein
MKKDTRYFHFLSKIKLWYENTDYTDYKPEADGSGVTYITAERSVSMTSTGSVGLTGPVTGSFSLSIVSNASVKVNYMVAKWGLSID